MSKILKHDKILKKNGTWDLTLRVLHEPLPASVSTSLFSQRSKTICSINSFKMLEENAITLIALKYFLICLFLLCGTICPSADFRHLSPSPRFLNAMLPESHLQSSAPPLEEGLYDYLCLSGSRFIPGFGPPRYKCSPVVRRSRPSLLIPYSCTFMPTTEKLKPCPLI